MEARGKYKLTGLPQPQYVAIVERLEKVPATRGYQISAEVGVRESQVVLEQGRHKWSYRSEYRPGTGTAQVAI